jgi:pimeloyl-ACP methyl ester carboxylesterase
MPYARNGDIKIYYEVEGAGPPVVIHHGLSASLVTMREFGFSDALRDEYRVILMDARGHGKSDKPHDPASYAAELVVGDVLAVLDSLHIETTNFFGYSYGGMVGYQCARLAPRRMRSVIAGGAGAPLPSAEINDGVIKMLKAGITGMVTAMERERPLSPELKEIMLTNDTEALIAICKSMALRASIMEDVPHMNIPFFLFSGENDMGYVRVKQTAELLPNVTFISLPGLDHNQAGSSPNLIIPQMKEFLAGVN